MPVSTVFTAEILTCANTTPRNERARMLTELAPYRETGHRLLMEALARRGGIRAAVEQRLGVGLDRGERAPDLVRHDRHEMRRGLGVLLNALFQAGHEPALASDRPLQRVALEGQGEGVPERLEQGAFRGREAARRGEAEQQHALHRSARQERHGGQRPGRIEQQAGVQPLETAGVLVEPRRLVAQHPVDRAVRFGHPRPLGARLVEPQQRAGARIHAQQPVLARPQRLSREPARDRGRRAEIAGLAQHEQGLAQRLESGGLAALLGAGGRGHPAVPHATCRWPAG